MIKKSFTLTELMITVAIVAFIALLALPQYFKVTERGRAAEGLVLLKNLREGQLRYGDSRGLTATDINDLDIENLGVKYFVVDELRAVSPKSTDVVAVIKRNEYNNTGFNGYRLSITADGQLKCTRASGGNICAALGY